MALDVTKYIGQKFGRRTILRSASPNGLTVTVEVQCECGNINTVSLSSLMHGRCNACRQCQFYSYKKNKKNNFYGEFK